MVHLRSLIRSVQERAHRAARAYVEFAIRKPWLVLGCALVVTLASAWGAQRLRVNPRLDALLPEDTPAARSLLEMSERVRSSSPLYLVVQSKDLDTSRALAKRLVDEVRTWSEAEWVTYRRDPEYFLERRLLLMPKDELAEYSEQIEERLRWEECKSLPGCVNMDEEPPPLPEASALQQSMEKNPDLSSLARILGAEPGKVFESQGSASSGTGAQPDEEQEATAGELCDPENRVCVVQASLTGDPSDLEYADMILKRSEALFERLKSESLDPDVKLAVSGQYRNGPLTRQAVIKDIASTTLISTLLVLLVVLAQFRGLRSLIALFTPIFAALMWTGGALSVIHPSLNLISSFTLAILTGMGIDFALHLLTHYTRERESGLTQAESILHTLDSVGSSLLVAAGTTALGFAALWVASFRGFSEMGPIAAFGITCAFVACLVLLPPLIAVMDPGDECPFKLREYRFSPWEFLRRNSRPVVLTGGLLTVVMTAAAFGIFSPGLQFEYDFRKLDSKDVGHGLPWGGALHGTNRTAIYLMADDEEALRETASALRENPPELLLSDGTLSLVVPGAFIPPDQKEKLELLGNLNTNLVRAKLHVSPEVLKDIERVEPLTRVKTPIVAAEMPQWVSDWLFERNGTFGTLGVLYTNLRGSDARQMEKLAKQLEELRKQHPNVRFASTVAQLGEVTPRLREETPLIVGLAIFGAAMGTVFLGRNWWRIVSVLLPMLTMTGISLGIAALTGIHVNLYNMLVFPLAFGIGIDGAVYVDWAFASSEPDKTLPTAARAVLGATLTTIAGFVALIWSANPGLASIGILASLMLGVALIGNLVWLPCLLWFKQQLDAKAKS
jgi:predicted RND superfamily exporter protein